MGRSQCNTHKVVGRKAAHLNDLVVPVLRPSSPMIREHHFQTMSTPSRVQRWFLWLKVSKVGVIPVVKPD